MSKVITFSRVFPSYHPRKGQPTYFVDKVLNSLYGSMGISVNYSMLQKLNTTIDDDSLYDFLSSIQRGNEELKNHTIRSGHRWKAGDYFSPRAPYNSKMIQFAPDIQIKKVWDFETDGCDFYINGNLAAYASSPSEMFLANLAANDGLQEQDLLDWFQYPKEFKGQIICWNENIEY